MTMDGSSKVTNEGIGEEIELVSGSVVKSFVDEDNV
jgi:hypothetical protein